MSRRRPTAFDAAVEDGRRTAAALHDVGKIDFPVHILRKAGALTDAEFDAVERHPEAAAAMILREVGDAGLAAIVRAHHERLDGSGYPAGLEGSEIPLGARCQARHDHVEAALGVPLAWWVLRSRYSATAPADYARLRCGLLYCTP